LEEVIKVDASPEKLMKAVVNTRPLSRKYWERREEGQQVSKPSDKRKFSAEEMFQELADVLDELETSSPRAKVALAHALFEDSLGLAILFHFAACHGAKEPAVLPMDVLRRINNIVPRATSRKVELAYAVGILPQSTLAPISKASRVRNDCVHKGAALTNREKGQATEAANYFFGMHRYLALRLYSTKPSRTQPPEYGVKTRS